MAKPRIEKIRIKHIPDEATDLSWLGSYVWEAPDLYLVKRHFVIQTQDDRGNKIWFIPGRNPEETYEWAIQHGYSKGNAEEMARKEVREDFERLQAYDKGHWYSMGIVAEAEVSYAIGSGSRRLETFSSGGLWGIESDAGEEYIREVEENQLADLKNHLKQFGVSLTDFNKLAQAALRANRD